LSSRPCFPCRRRSYNAAGPHRFTGVTRLHRYRGPVRHPLAFGPLPGFSGYRTYLASGDFSSGARRASPVAWHVLCHRAVASTPPKRVGRISQISAAHAAFAHPRKAQPSGFPFRGHIRVHFRYGPVTRTFPQGRLVDRLQIIAFAPLCYPSYGASDFYPGRSVLPAQHASLRWTHPGSDSSHRRTAPAHVPAGSDTGP